MLDYVAKADFSIAKETILTFTPVGKYVQDYNVYMFVYYKVILG